QTGAVLGPLFMYFSVLKSHSFQASFLKLGFPAAGALLALLVARLVYPQAGKATPKQIQAKNLPQVFWIYVAAAGVLALGFVDFPVLAAHFQKNALVQPEYIPLLFAGAMGINGIADLVFGKLFDRIGIASLSIGILISLLGLPLGFLGGTPGAVAAVICW